MKNGTLINDGWPKSHPASSGLSAAPVVRATPVMPDAADRSSGTHYRTSQGRMSADSFSTTGRDRLIPITDLCL
jgi:hypothetical protein